ncbi:secreted frizzled-related protein 3-like [Antedon mediterranea]|uniref:secreted frizzled-related protein 3-like n=1 Tax=Antedon mediterranea TaxID=105859 RepID=UPI003AF7FE03
MSLTTVTISSAAIAFFLLSTSVVCSNAATCELIKLPMCKDMPWNKTRMPNHLHHSTQENAKLAISQFQGLAATNCSSHLIFFLCSMYAPICAYGFQNDAAIPPCKSLCLRVKRGCEPIMLRHKVKWPDYLACNDFPEYDRGVCISPEAIVEEMPRDPSLDRPKEVNVQPQTTNVNPPHVAANPRPLKPQVCDNCIGPPKANIRVFLEKQYEYAIRANVTGLEYPPALQSGRTWTIVNVIDVLHFQDISIPKDEVILWSHDDCVCPDVIPGKEYLIMCDQHLADGHLMLRDDCIVEEWNSEWPSLVKKWYKRLKKAQRQESGKKTRTKKRRQRKKRGTAQPPTQRSRSGNRSRPNKARI